MSTLHKLTVFILAWWSLMVVFSFWDEVRPPYATFQTEIAAAFVSTVILWSMYSTVFNYSDQQSDTEVGAKDE